MRQSDLPPLIVQVVELEPRNRGWVSNFGVSVISNIPEECLLKLT